MVRLIQRAQELRLLLRAGAVVFAVGAALDIAAHVLLPGNLLPLTLHHETAEGLAHGITFAGMVVLLIGVLTAPRPSSP